MLIGHGRGGIWITLPMFVVGARSGAVPWKRAASPTHRGLQAAGAMCWWLRLGRISARRRHVTSQTATGHTAVRVRLPAVSPPHRC
jgi:hypothetical protein